MAECFRVVWFDSSALDDPLVDARIVLDRQTATRNVYLVANQAGEQLATLLAAHRPDIVRGVLLVRNPDTRSGGPEATLGKTRGELHRFLDDHGVLARSVVPSAAASEHATPRVKDASVVEAVARELLTLGVSVTDTPVGPTPCEPPRSGSLVGQAATAAWEEVGSAWHGLRNVFHRAEGGQDALGDR